MLADRVLLRYTPLQEAEINDCCFYNTTNNYLGIPRNMPKGLKETSSLITIGFSVIESAINTFTQTRVDLQLNPLDNEVFVVQAIDIQGDFPDAVPGLNTTVNSAVTTTSRTLMPSLSDSSCLATSESQIRATPGGIEAGAAFMEHSMDTPPAGLMYIGIISTNDFFVQVEGANNLNARRTQGKLYGYRARADASVYAALVQSEVLSA